MKNMMPKRSNKLGLVGIVALSSTIGLGSLTGCSRDYEKETVTVPALDEQIYSSETLDQKLIGYNVDKGSYVLFEEKEATTDILGDLTLVSNQNFLKGEAYDKTEISQRVFESDGRVSYMLPAGKYSISNSEGKIKDFSSEYPLQLIELKDDSEKHGMLDWEPANSSIMYTKQPKDKRKTEERNEVKERSLLIGPTKIAHPIEYSSTLVTKEEVPCGTIIRAVQPEYSAPINSSLRRNDVEEYFIPKE